MTKKKECFCCEKYPVVTIYDLEIKSRVYFCEQHLREYLSLDCEHKLLQMRNSYQKQDHFRDATKKVDNQKVLILKNALSYLDYLHFYNFINENERENIRIKLLMYVNENNIKVTKSSFTDYEVQEITRF